MTLSDLVREALREEEATGDRATAALGLAPRFGQGRLLAKEDLILSGTTAFEQTLEALEPTLKVQWYFREGDQVLKNQIVCHLTGDLVQILKAERVAVNFISHLSGIATLTRAFVQAVGGLETLILDTRKTLPGFRELERKAVVHGGGMNHPTRFPDFILIKENHLQLAGGMSRAFKRIRSHSDAKIEVECSNIQAVKEATDNRAEAILLDNMSDPEISEAVMWIKASDQKRQTRTLIEASGNMKLDRVRSVAELGVDAISVGALTHSAPASDLSLGLEWQPPGAPAI